MVRMLQKRIYNFCSFLTFTKFFVLTHVLLCHHPFPVTLLIKVKHLNSQLPHDWSWNNFSVQIFFCQLRWIFLMQKGLNFPLLSEFLQETKKDILSSVMTHTLLLPHAWNCLQVKERTFPVRITSSFGSNPVSSQTIYDESLCHHYKPLTFLQHPSNEPTFLIIPALWSVPLSTYHSFSVLWYFWFQRNNLIWCE